MTSQPITPLIEGVLSPESPRMPEPAWGRRVSDRVPLPAPLPQREVDPDGGARTGRYDLEVRSGHLDEALHLAPHLALTHAVTAAAVFFLFQDQASPLYLSLLFFSVVVPATVATIGAGRYRRRRPGGMEIATVQRLAEGLVLTLGLAWSSMPLALFPVSDADHRMYVVALCAGLMATTYTFGSSRRLGLLFAIPLTLATSAALFGGGGMVAPALAILFVIYGLFVLFTAGRISRLSGERILDRVRVGAQNETISLLLHEFEENTSDWLWETDAEGRLQHVSERIAQVAGERLDALRDAPLAALFLGVRQPRPMSDEIAEILAWWRSARAFASGRWK